MHMLAGGRGTFTRARLTGITAVMAGDDSTAAMRVLALKRRQLRETARRSGAGVGALQANFFVGHSLTRFSPLADPDAAYDLGIVG